MGGFLYIHLGLINATFAPYHLFLALLEKEPTSLVDSDFVCMSLLPELPHWDSSTMSQSLVSVKSIPISHTSALGVVR